jgi:hypothetical protein
MALNGQSRMSDRWLVRIATKLNMHHHQLALDKWVALTVTGGCPILAQHDKQMPDLYFWTKSATVMLIDQTTRDGIEWPIPYVW